MRFLLDTNVISEIVRPSPCKSVVSWLKAQRDDALFLSSVTVAEIMRGVSRLNNGKKRDKLLTWVRQDIPNRFSGRILSFDTKCAFLQGAWQGEADKQGCSFPAADAQIAAIAVRFELVLVTRNVKDMARLPVKFMNPWDVSHGA